MLDRRIDVQMTRTQHRPLPTGHLLKTPAVIFAALLAAGSMLVLWPTVGGLVAILTFCSLIGYAVVYTLWLKHATPQNIVIGGASRRRSAGPGLGCRHPHHRTTGAAAVLDYFHVDSAAFLGAGHCPAR